MRVLSLFWLLYDDYLLLLCFLLGAGVASVLAVKWESVFPGLRCVALAPPCTFSLQVHQFA